MNSINLSKRYILRFGKTLNLSEELQILLKKIDTINETNEFDNYINELTDKISSCYLTSPHVLKSKIQDEFYTQNDVKYLFKHLIVDELKSKPINISDKKSTNEKVVDPFAPPFVEGQVIEENFGNLGTHRIFFSKFAVMKEHLLLVTRDFYSQYTHLTFDDFKNGILLMDVINGVVFFNGGKNAGASQPRKHLQAIPFKSMYDKDFGIFLLINEESNLIQIEGCENNFSEFKFCHIKQFIENGINHCLIKYSQNLSNKIRKIITTESLDLYTEFMLYVYNLGLNYLNLLEDEENITINYSVIFTDEWLFITPRRTHEVPMEHGILNINSIGYLMTILLKNETLCEELKTKNILKDVFAELS